jgi:energy-converting hydrogenase B subunit D
VTDVVLLISMLSVGALGTMTAVVRNPVDQLITLAFFGITVINLCIVLAAPDVALSALVVSSVAFPLMVVLALAKVRKREE